MQRWRRYSLTLMWSLWLILFGTVAALACMSHPTAHLAAHPHPLLCLDASTPVVPGGNGPTLAAEARKGQSPLPLVLTPYSADMTLHPPLALYLLPHRFFHTQDGNPLPTAVSLRVILQL